MKTKIKILIFCFIALSVKATDDYNINLETNKTSQKCYPICLITQSKNGDTIKKHTVEKSNGKVLIIDSVIIKKKDTKIKTVLKEKPNYRGFVISVFALCFAIMAIIIKRKKNG